jgi:hypothetical protein
MSTQTNLQRRQIRAAVQIQYVISLLAFVE